MIYGVDTIYKMAKKAFYDIKDDLFFYLSINPLQTNNHYCLKKHEKLEKKTKKTKNWKKKKKKKKPQRTTKEKKNFKMTKRN